MKRFSRLYAELDESNRTSDKLRALERYFAESPAEDAAWGLYFLSGRKTKRAVKSSVLKRCALEVSGIPEWLFDECHALVGDYSETVALLLPEPHSPSDASPEQRDAAAAENASRDVGIATLPLHQFVAKYITPLPACNDEQAEALVKNAWKTLNAAERFVFHKLLSVNFRVGVQRRLVARALAHVASVEPAVMEHRMMGDYSPSAAVYSSLIAQHAEIDDVSKPYPFFLASQLEHIHGVELDLRQWQIEWKWDGIRAQLIRRTNSNGARTVVIWSRGEQLITNQFPELTQIAEALPDDAVLDGEVLAWSDAPVVHGTLHDGWNRGRPMPFGVLQTRLNRTRRPLSRGLFDRTDLVFMAYDLIELHGEDYREQPLARRRHELERIASHIADDVPLRVSQTMSVATWQEAAALRGRALVIGAEGLMLKPLASFYGVGRTRGDLLGNGADSGWLKWKIDPFTLDAVLIAAQPGSGKRAGLYTDYTFGLWHDGVLLPFAKAYSGLDDSDILRVDAFVRRNTIAKAGPVRTVKPQLVFEIAFEAINDSPRHKSGIAVRFPRIARWRHDKTPLEADTLDSARALMRLSSGTTPRNTSVKLRQPTETRTIRNKRENTKPVVHDDLLLPGFEGGATSP